MFKKKILILVILLVSLLAVSAVSAADNATSDVISVEEKNVDFVCVQENSITLEENDDVGNLTELSNLISNTPEGAILELDKDYKYDSGNDSDYYNGIKINNSITVDGKGYTIDGTGMGLMFKVASDDIILKNINIKLDRTSSGYDYSYSSFLEANSVNNLSIINCGFEGNGYRNFMDLTDTNNSQIEKCNLSNIEGSWSNDCYLRIQGNNNIIYACDFINATVGISIYGSNHKIQGCKFIKSYPCFLRMDEYYMDSVTYYCVNCTISDCIFNDTYGEYSSFSVNEGINIKLDNCTFIKGRMVYFTTKNGIITNCTFMDMDSMSEGTAICLQGEGETINNCKFINNFNYISNGGAIYVGRNNEKIINSVFINCTSIDKGGAIYSIGNNLTISNNSFINNNAPVGKSIYIFDGTINDNYFDSDEKEIFAINNVKIIKKLPILTLNDISFDFNVPITFSITLTDNINNNLKNRNVTFILSNKNQSKIFNKITDNLGQSHLFEELRGLGCGIWEANVIFEGSENYAPCNATATITVLLPSTSLTIDDINTTVGHEVTLIANVNSSLTVNEGIVTFFDGENSIGDANVYDGVATLNYSPTTAGEHSITAIFTSENYQSANASAVLSIAKANVDLSIGNIESVNFTNPSKFAVNVNSNNKPVIEGEIKFYVNDVLVGSSGIYNGEADFNYVANTTGSFTLVAVYNETENYLASNATSYFYVNQMPTKLSGESIIFDEQAYKTFTTELKDSNNKGVDGQPVTIEVIKYSGESARFNGTSDSNGITIYDVGNLAGGMWYVTGIYEGNQNYIRSSFVDKFIVIKMNTTTDIEDTGTPQVNHNYKIKANIHDENGKLVKEGIVQFYLDGVDIGSVDLSQNQGHQSALANGVLGAVNPMFEYSLGADNDVYLNYIPTKAGKHTLTAVYEGTTIYRSSNSTTPFEVSGSNTMETVIAASNVVTVYNGGKYLVINLKDTTGKAVSGVKLKVVLGGKNYYPVTNAKGNAIVSTNGLAPVKTYVAKIYFLGNSKYDKSSTTAKVAVKKDTPKIAAKVVTFKKTVKVKKYSIRLTTSKNVAIKNAKVFIKIGKLAYSAVTTKKGYATFKITKLTKKGKYNGVVSFKGNKYFNAKAVKVRLVVK